MEFTYELPNEKNVLNTVLTMLHSSVDVNDRIIYEIIKTSTLSYQESTEFSQQRWNAYKLGITFRMPTTDYAKNSKLLPGVKSKLREICSKIIPSECGYDLTSLEVVPEITTTKVDAIDEISSTVSIDKKNILSSDIIEKGKQMANAYIMMYCLENLLRKYIDSVLSRDFSDDYVSKINIPNAVKNKIESRKNEEAKNKWLPLRGDSVVYYLDFNELGDIIKNNWEHFKTSFPSQEWLKVKIDELYSIRCLIAHNAYINDTSMEILKVYYNQIVHQIGE